METVLVTGGCGFIGANFLNRFVPGYPAIRFVNVDKLTYAGNPGSLEPIRDLDNYFFEHVDICDESKIAAVFEQYNPDRVFHFAAESHVDRSIHGPRDFLVTNVMGTLNLLEACRATWTNADGKLFHHVSTDEVYGSLGDQGAFTEDTRYDPSSPYSASKAGSDHLVRAYSRTYGLPIVITNCSNNYGPLQFPEKLIPLMILNALEGQPLPVYGEGKNIRDWLYVTDHCDAIWHVADQGKPGETYNVGGNCERTNIEIVETLCDRVAEATGRDPGALKGLITFVKDRPGHDFRYAIDSTKLKNELGWSPKETLESGLQHTVAWYHKNDRWVAGVRDGSYRKWIDDQYGQGG
jgi:dTDP-glucose 4,6-dehydratase